MRNRQFFLFMTFALSASLLGACNISGNVTIQPVTDMPGTAVPVTTEIVSPAVAGAASTVSPNPPIPPEVACKDHSNIRSGPSGIPYYWRFFVAFRQDDFQVGCIEVIRTDNPTQRWSHAVPCALHDDQEAELGAMEVPDVVPHSGSAARKIESIKLSPNNYLECDFHLNDYLEQARQENQELGIKPADIAATYSYSYFSISALTILSPSGIYSGSLLAFVPQDCDQSKIYCQPTDWSATSVTTDTVTFHTTFNGVLSTSLTTPVAITYTSNLMQAWWVGARAQYTTLNGEWGINVEHHLDQAIMADNVQKIFRHQTVEFGKRFGSLDADARVQIWGGASKIFIGMPPGGTAAFNGQIFQIAIDPGGAGSPDSAG